MKKRLFFLLVLFATFATAAQTTDAQLNRRLNTYLQLNKDLHFENMMDYIHPGLFRIAPREALLQTFQEAFNNDAVKIRFDSMAIVTVGPNYKGKATAYKKIDYFMRMQMSFTDTAFLANADARAMMIENMKTAFPGKQVVYNEKTNSLDISGTQIMFAVKDRGKGEWMFIGYEKNPELINALFPQDVIDHYKLL